MKCTNFTKFHIRNEGRDERARASPTLRQISVIVISVISVTMRYYICFVFKIPVFFNSSSWYASSDCCTSTYTY